jgi:hypothetical protein
MVCAIAGAESYVFEMCKSMKAAGLAQRVGERSPSHERPGCERTGITQERWDEYRRLFSRNDITQGIQRDPETTDAFIIVGSFGLLNRVHSNGYLYCGPGPSHRYPTCSSPQSFGEHRYSPGDEAYPFRKLADRWYAYSEGPS